MNTLVPEPLHLGFHYHIPMLATADSTLRTPGYLGRFLDSLAAHCQSLTCFMHAPRPDEIAQMDYTIQSTNLRWVDIGAHTSIPKRMLSAGRIADIVRRESAQLDLMLIRGPTPLLATIAAAGHVPTALLLVGDYVAGVDDLPQPRWRKEAIRLWSQWNYRQQVAVARRSLTFVNSRKLYEQLKPHVRDLVETRTTTLSADDFYERGDTCQAQPTHLLYTGRLDRAKGLFEMVAAVDRLTQQGHDVVLDIVGWATTGDTIVEELEAAAAQRGISERIIFHGYKAVGAELFAYYKAADIYVIASQSSEGFPRTIWEAMAHSLPVVATRVGAIPHYLAHGETAWLVDAGDTTALAEGIAALMMDATTRRRLIMQARQVARANTLEQRTAELVGAMHDWLPRHV